MSYRHTLGTAFAAVALTASLGLAAPGAQAAPKKDAPATQPAVQQAPAAPTATPVVDLRGPRDVYRHLD